MTMPISLEQVEALAGQLTVPERVRLVEKLNRELRIVPAAAPQSPEEIARFLAELDTIAAQIPGDFDAVADIHNIRDEQAARV